MGSVILSGLIPEALLFSLKKPLWVFRVYLLGSSRKSRKLVPALPSLKALDALQRVLVGRNSAKRGSGVAASCLLTPRFGRRILA